MNNDKNIMIQSAMLSLKFVDNLDRIGAAFAGSHTPLPPYDPLPLSDVCIIERRLEDAVAAHADGMQVH